MMDVTLTDDLRYLNPVSDYVNSRLADATPLEATWVTQCTDHPDLGDWNDGHTSDTAARYGIAMEWAIGFDLAETVPYRQMLEVFRADGGDRAAKLIEAAGFAPTSEGNHARMPWTDWRRQQRPSDRPLHASPPLLTACWNASGVAKLLHKEGIGEADGILTCAAVWNMVYKPVANAPWLTGLWDTYCRIGRPQLDRLPGPVEVSPRLVHRYATADLILGTTLIDIKFTAYPEEKLLEWLRQTVGYALLTGDRRVDRVGVYLVRQGRLVTWSITKLLPGLNLEEARRDFTELVSQRAPVRS